MNFRRFTTVVVPAVAAFQGQQPYDIVSVVAVMAEINITDQSKVSNLKTWITQASAAAAKFCNRVFPVETLQEQLFPPRDAYPPVAIGGVDPLELARSPIASQPNQAGLGPPGLAPTLSITSGGMLAAARCYVRATYVTALGETAVSPEANVVVPASDLLVVTSPPQDIQGIATGWNVYVGTAAGQETLQNAAPLAIGTNWTEPLVGLLTGSALPSYLSIVENGNGLAEGIDFLIDYATGLLTRLDTNGWPRRWPALPIVAFYQAGFVLTDPTFADAVEAVTILVKGRYFAQSRDPALRQENVEGVYSAQWWYAAGPGAATGDLPPNIQAKLERYRAPVVG